MMRHALAGILMVAAVSGARAQGIGSYLNFETPVLKPIAVASVGANSFLLGSNTPDAAVEIYATADLHFVARVPVGAEPVSIAVKPTALPSGGVRCYAVNWLGDSITLFDLELNLSGDLV